ncbi:MAG: phosphoribosylamine--glycine ligase [Vicinamibacterales bacterium]
MRILVLGTGGREHALCWRLQRDPEVTLLLAAPGNPGIAALTRCVPVDPLNPDAVLAVAVQERIDLTVVGPEAPLERGLADLFRQHGRPIVGPSRAGAALECSKVFSKHFMAAHDIPTARFAVCDTPTAALEAVCGASFDVPLVVKADGLAAGKGVVVAESRAEAEAAVRAAMVDLQFGSAGSRLVVEECLTGPEVSLFALCDGMRAIPLSTAQDHKRIFDEDRGPNTGGMGAFAPSPLATDDLRTFAMHRVIQPVLEGMRAAGEPYVGFLYVSLMLTPQGPKVIEFNVRFGDPEAQVILPQLEGSLAAALYSAATGDLRSDVVREGTQPAVGVVLASRGYPAAAEHGQPIDGLAAAADVPGALIFHAGTAVAQGRLVTAGGRVLTVVGRGATFQDAMTTAYRAVDRIHFAGMQCRRDIGRKAADNGRENAI